MRYLTLNRRHVFPAQDELRDGWASRSWTELLLTAFVGAFVGLPVMLILTATLPALARQVPGISWPDEWMRLAGGDLRAACVWSAVALLGGLLAGSAQLAVLPYARHPTVWLLSSALGWALAWPLVLVIVVSSTPPLVSAADQGVSLLGLVAVMGATGGLLVGVVQCIGQWRLWHERARWALMSTLGWCLAAVTLSTWFAR
jgi:hypothetical protein